MVFIYKKITIGFFFIMKVMKSPVCRCDPYFPHLRFFQCREQFRKCQADSSADLFRKRHSLAAVLRIVLYKKYLTALFQEFRNSIRRGFWNVVIFRNDQNLIFLGIHFQCAADLCPVRLSLCKYI